MFKKIESFILNTRSQSGTSVKCVRIWYYNLIMKMMEPKT